MLSATYEIDDIKSELKPYNFYEYEDKNFSATGDTTTDSTSITGLSKTAGIIVGMSISGSGIPSGATVSSIDGTTSITISSAATATASTVTLTFTLSGDSEFESDLTRAISDAMYDRMYPTIGSGWYDTLAAKDKTSLTEQETYIYRAEVYYAIAEYVLWKSTFEKYKRNSKIESESHDGVTKSYQSGVTGKEWLAEYYIGKAVKCMNQADVSDVVTLQRKSGIHEYSSDKYRRWDYGNNV